MIDFKSYNRKKQIEYLRKKNIPTRKERTEWYALLRNYKQGKIRRFEFLSKVKKFIDQ